MSYNLTLTNGTALLTLADQTADTTTTSVSLVGRNFSGFGLLLNENFIKMLENFSSTNAPGNPLVGQLWWDSVNKHLSVWQGSNWKVISSSQTGLSAPPNPVTGDFWWKTDTGILSVYGGTSWVQVSSNSSATTGAILQNTIYDTGSTPHIVGNIMVSNKLTAVISTDSTAFTPGTAIPGIPVVNPGFNFPSGITVTGNTSIANLAISGITSFSSITVNGNASVTGNTSLANLSVTGTTSLANLWVSGNANLANLSVSGATSFGGNVSFTGNVTLPNNPVTLGNISGNIIPTANLTYNLGSSTAWWNNIYGTAIHAQYADLAERFEADMEYQPGTVVEMGGPAEITAASTDLSEDVFGVISTNAAYLMNSGAGSNATHPPIAVQGRVPVRVTGTIRKGDRLVSAGNGIARAGKRSEITAWNVIGRALEDKTTPGEGTIEAVVKLNS